MKERETMKYRFETHAHTSDVSRCGHVPAEEMVRLYEKAGYSGMVITDHINPVTFRDLDLPTWDDQAEHFLRGYRSARAAASPDFTVLLGAEFHFHENSNDYLVYGLTEELIFSLGGDILDWGIERLSRFCREKGLLLIQAHPFRNSMVVNDPRLLDGIEIMNGHPRHDSRNFVARSWAEHYGLLYTSGSDAHMTGDVGRGGLLTDAPIRSLRELIAEIRRGPELIIPEDQRCYFE